MRVKPDWRSDVREIRRLGYAATSSRAPWRAPRTYRCRAIVLDKTKLGGERPHPHLLADSGAQVRAVAKGARKPGSRLAARCELACSVDLLLARGRSLDVVSQAELMAAPLGPPPITTSS